MRLLYSVRFHVIVALSSCVLGTVLAWWFFTAHQHFWYCWLALWMLVVNAVTFAYYGLDKFLARSLSWRVPEVVLHLLGAVGGSPAALLAMRIFRHKTIKTSFRLWFWLIIVLQICLALYIVKWVGWT